MIEDDCASRAADEPKSGNVAHGRPTNGVTLRAWPQSSAQHVSDEGQCVRELHAIIPAAHCAARTARSAKRRFLSSEESMAAQRPARWAGIRRRRRSSPRVTVKPGMTPAAASGNAARALQMACQPPADFRPGKLRAGWNRPPQISSRFSSAEHSCICMRTPNWITREVLARTGQRLIAQGKVFADQPTQDGFGFIVMACGCVRS